VSEDASSTGFTEEELLYPTFRVLLGFREVACIRRSVAA